MTMKKNKNKKMSSIWCSLLIGASMVLGGCSEVSHSGNDTVSEPIEITFAHFQDEEGAFHDAIQQAIDQFEADNSNVDIIEEYYPPDAYDKRAYDWDKEDEVRDITVISGTMVEVFSENGTILDLTDCIGEYGIDKKIEEMYFQELTYEDAIYAVPWESAAYGFILYNEGIFEEAGIEAFPTTLKEMSVAIEKLRNIGYIPMGMGNKLLWPADSLTFSAFVNNFVGNEWYESILNRDGMASFKDEEFIEALSEFQKLAEQGLFNNNMVSYDNEQRGKWYQDREVAMISAGNWECQSIEDLAPEVAGETKVALWPSVSAESEFSNSMVQSSAWGLGVGANIEEEKLSYVLDFIANYVCSQDFGRVMTEDHGVLVPWDVDYKEKNINSVTQKLIELEETDITYCMNWDSTLPSEVKSVYQVGLQDLMVGKITPEELATKMDVAYRQP